jgi:hypothetical protein
MFKSLAASPLRKFAFVAAALAAIAGVGPAAAGGYDDQDVIYADQQQGFMEYDRRRPLVREEPVIEDDDVIPARHIVRQLRRQGYAQVQEISLRGDTYRIMAIRNNGGYFKLRVDAYSGEILTAQRVGWVGRHIRPEPRPLPRRHSDPGVTIEFGWGSQY